MIGKWTRRLRPSRAKSVRFAATLVAVVLLLLAVAAAAGMVYHGNRNSHVFHRPGCRYYDCKNCVVVFHSRQEALEAGFRPCKVCNP